MSEPQLDLTQRDRELASRLANNPMDVFQGKTLGWLEDFIRITVGTNVNAILTSVYGVGHYRIVPEDLTANTSEYVYSDAFGDFLYMNGAAVSQTTYAALYTEWGANKWGSDSGGNFLLGDSRGRGLFMCGTHANAGLGDNDGQTVANRQAKHVHTNNLAVDKGSLAISPDPHTHTYIVPDSPVARQSGAGADAVPSRSGGWSTDATSLSITGNPALSGTIGTGTSGDAPAHLYIGSLLVRF